MLANAEFSEGLVTSNGEPNNTKHPRLLDQVRDVIRCKHYSIRTEHS